jgi:hypothetical protein
VSRHCGSSRHDASCAFPPNKAPNTFALGASWSVTADVASADPTGVELSASTLAWQPDRLLQSCPYLILAAPTTFTLPGEGGRQYGPPGWRGELHQARNAANRTSGKAPSQGGSDGPTGGKRPTLTDLLCQVGWAKWLSGVWSPGATGSPRGRANRDRKARPAPLGGCGPYPTGAPRQGRSSLHSSLPVTGPRTGRVGRSRPERSWSRRLGCRTGHAIAAAGRWACWAAPKMAGS